MKTFLIRGVPTAMQQDGWWLSETKPRELEPPSQSAIAPRLWHIGLLCALIALGDFLVWQVVPGLSLALFCAAMMTVSICVAGKELTRRKLAFVAGGSFLAIMPLVEVVQPLSLAIAIMGLSFMLVTLAGVHPQRGLRAVLRLWPLGMQQGVSDAAVGLQGADPRGLPHVLRQFVFSWLMPIVLGLVFVVLLLVANPVADQWVADIMHSDVDLPAGERIGFWVCLVPFIWTVLCLPRIRERLNAGPKAARQGPKREGFINPASTSRALVLFNAVFAIQTILDIIYLYGGVGLPEGITYAQYAHRGAYPLLITALLAGAFALLTRRWTDGDFLLRSLLLLWVGQNIALVLSSLVRLELYVEVYGLTHLRLAAAIWMGLVACGLALVLWQIWKGFSNSWMLIRSGVLGFGVLYVCAFISFDAAIARYNLGQGIRLDARYLCHLGDAAKPIIAAKARAENRQICLRRPSVSMPSDWREWGFRNARARNSLAVIQAEAPL